MHMRFLVRFLRRRGKVLPWKALMNQEPRYGDLRIEECLEIGRAKEPDAPILMDVHITAMSPQAFTLTGFERVDGTELVQAWLVTARNML